MTNKQKQILGIAFIIYPLALITYLAGYGNMDITHPFILLNISLVTMGAGLSITQWLFKIGVFSTLVLALYTTAMLPSQAAIDATNKELEALEQQNIPTTLLGSLFKAKG